jgi:hypothetical protein
MSETGVTIEPWGSDDLPLLRRLMGDPRMTEHLGGPESPEKLRARQSRYERTGEGGRMLKIVEEPSGAGAGWVGYWTRRWHEEPVYEIGWMPSQMWATPRQTRSAASSGSSSARRANSNSPRATS